MPIATPLRATVSVKVIKIKAVDGHEGDLSDITLTVFFPDRDYAGTTARITKEDADTLVEDALYEDCTAYYDVIRSKVEAQGSYLAITRLKVKKLTITV